VSECQKDGVVDEKCDKQGTGNKKYDEVRPMTGKKCSYSTHNTGSKN